MGGSHGISAPSQHLCAPPPHCSSLYTMSARPPHLPVPCSLSWFPCCRGMGSAGTPCRCTRQQHHARHNHAKENPSPQSSQWQRKHHSILGGVLFCCNGVAKQKLIHWGCVCAQEQPGGHKVWISPSLEQGSHGTARRFPVSCHTVISVSVQTLLGCFWD